jgi:DNA-binding MarR family transcriptional regulator
LSRKRVQNTHNSTQFRALHMALIEILSVMNRPQRDEALLRAAGVTLDRALFPPLVVIDRLGPIGVVDLADRIGRDYTTVSRQVAKLDALELIERQDGAKDRRVREAVIAPKGKALTDRIDAARERMAARLFADWDAADLETLVRLMQKFAEGLSALPAEASRKSSG